MTTAMIWLSALPLASEGGSVVVIASVCRYSRPDAAPPDLASSEMPSTMPLGMPLTSSSRKRDTCRALRATSVMPFLLLSSSSSVRIGR